MQKLKRNNYTKVMNLNGIDTLSGYISNKVSIEDLQKVKKMYVNVTTDQPMTEPIY